MSNVAGKAYAMNVVTPMRPRRFGISRTWVNHFLFYAARALPDRLMGLLGLSIIHFARWVIVRRDQWPDQWTECCHKGKSRLKHRTFRPILMIMRAR